MIKEKPAYRHELKYEITRAQYLLMRQKLRYLMRPDPHVGADGRYRITSLYFDNCCDKALREKMDGVNRREKFRIRYYEDRTGELTLEKKQKINILCLKTAAPMEEAVCRRILAGEDNWLPPEPDGLLAELHFKQKTQLLRPRTVVIYEREPYLFEAGNVRITFDMAVRTGFSTADFLNPVQPAVPAVRDGHLILEVKYDSFLPSAVMELLQTGVIRIGAFSKYAACRQYE